MLTLKELDGQLYRYAGNATFEPVDTVDKADSVMFLCPACFAANDGPVGTHSIRVDFKGRGTPDSVCIRNAQKKPVRWAFSGSTIQDLSLSPSILLLHDCQWHGFVTAGAISNA